MTMKRSQILDILFWISLIIGIILFLWEIFGNNPAELSVIITFMSALLFKIWSISYEIREFKHEVKISFAKVKADLDNLKTRLKVKK